MTQWSKCLAFLGVLVTSPLAHSAETPKDSSNERDPGAGSVKIVSIENSVYGQVLGRDCLPTSPTGIDQGIAGDHLGARGAMGAREQARPVRHQGGPVGPIWVLRDVDRSLSG